MPALVLALHACGCPATCLRPVRRCIVQFLYRPRRTVGSGNAQVHSVDIATSTLGSRERIPCRLMHCTLMLSRPLVLLSGSCALDTTCALDTMYAGESACSVIGAPGKKALDSRPQTPDLSDGRLVFRRRQEKELAQGLNDRYSTPH
jgi:hypothetical protein